jgi:HSP20 family protein
LTQYRETAERRFAITLMHVKGKGEFSRLQGEVQELIDELWQVPRFYGRRRGFRPAVDCVVTNDPAELKIVVDLAGVDPQDVHVLVDEQTILIAGERRRPCKEGRYQQMEIEYGHFERRLQLPMQIDPADARAEYERGLLTIVLPVALKPVARTTVTIEIGTER